MPFICSICAEEASQICSRCTKDVCGNHLCEKCLKCSDCCECELALDEPAARSLIAAPAEAPAEPHPIEPHPIEPTPETPELS